MPRERFQDPLIKQNGNGSFYIRPWVDVLDSFGKPSRRKRTIVLGAASIGKREAHRLKTETMATINRSSYVIQSQVLFSKLVDVYRTRHLSTLKETTQYHQETILRKHIVPAFKDQALHEITTERIEDWLKTKAALSWCSRTDLRDVLSNIFNKARKWKFYQDENPVRFITVGRKRMLREKVKFSDDQLRRLLAMLPDDARLLAHLCLFCGLRVSEALGLEERHLNFAAGLITIDQRYCRGNIDTPKSQMAERIVPMGHLATDLRRAFMGDPSRPVVRVLIPADRGRAAYYTRSDTLIARTYLIPSAKAIGVYRKGFGWHAFRRHAVTHFNAELGVTQAMKMAGHSDVEMSRIYTLADQELQSAVVKKWQENLMGTTGEVQ